MKKLRIIIDVVMYIFFIILMGHHVTGNFIHEILGTGIIILFIIHNLLNIKFYKVIFKGKYNLKRLFLTLIDILLRIIQTFMESQKFSGKTMIPFCTSGGTGISGCEKDLRNAYSGYNWKEGKRLTGREDKSFIENWIKA